VTTTRCYFDYNATTPVDPAVAAASWPVLCEVYGNASSIHHYGQRARQTLEAARAQVAALLAAADPKEIVLLSGGTEADNLAVLGVTRSAKREARHVVTSAIEHPAVLGACARLEREGVAVTRVAVGPAGVIDPDDVQRAMRPETVLVSVMHANNELGTVQPIAEVARIAHQAGALLHSDGVQAAGKVPIDVRALGVDLYSISGHKFYAPKGVGALYVRKGLPLEPLQYGGRHEMGLRAGTESVFLAAALGAAAARCREGGAQQELGVIAALRDRLERGILARIADAQVNAAGSPRVPNTSSIVFEGIESEALVIALDLRGFAVSGGAACSSGAVEPSHVLTAIGLSRPRARSTVRFSLGRGNTEAQVDALVDAVAESVAHLRHLAPAYKGRAGASSR
jgi:cysteine desulfurase